MALLELDHLSVVYANKVRAVDNVTLSLSPGETLSLVGESGSGKSSLARAILGLARPSAGRIVHDGADTATLDRAGLQRFRRAAQMIFQDPVASLSPRLTIRRLLEEPLVIHGIALGAAWPGVLEILRRVGLSDAVLDKYPHQVSGGQARRVGIARALALKPKLLIADEPTAGLDVSVQGDLMNLMADLQAEFALTYLIISHNLAVVRAVSDRVAVMYLGAVVELGPARDLFERPAHPYTRALIAASPRIDPDRGPRPVLEGEIPSPLNPPSGCVFHTRCPLADDHCRRVVPETRTLPDGRAIRCHKPLNGG